MDRNAGKAPYMENAVVALRKESVDRNRQCWRIASTASVVALRKESVDRNAYGRRITRKITRRSPQGERG